MKYYNRATNHQMNIEIPISFCLKNQFLILMFYDIFQIVGCVGALRLNKRLLKGYWIILLCLLVGDVVVGFIWLFRFDAISKGLENDLSHRLSTEYRHNIKG